MPDRALRRLFAVIDGEEAAMQRLLAALVAIPSENPPGAAYDACVAAIHSAAVGLGLQTERLAIPNTEGRVAVRASIGDGKPVLYFHGHYDVVPAQARTQFTPRVEGGTMFGRGSSDMKSGLVAMLYAAHALSTIRAPLRGRLALLFVPDEETGGAGGSAALTASGDLGQDGVGMLLPEPTSGKVWYASRGAITLRVTVRGRSAHVGVQHQGLNALEQALPILRRLFELKHELDARGSILLVGGRVECGSNFNVVPHECRFTLDRRTNPDEDLEHEKKSILEILEAARQQGVEVSVSTIQEGRSSSTPQDHALGRALAESVRTVTGEPPAFEMCPGLLETRFYVERGVPAYAYGPGILAVSHGPNEFVRMERMVQCAKTYAMTALQVLGEMR